MAAQTNELLIWDGQVPMVNASTDSEFEVWEGLSPDEDRDEGLTSGVAGARRRVVDF